MKIKVITMFLILIVSTGCNSKNEAQSFSTEGEYWKGDLIINESEPELLGSGELVNTTFEYIGDAENIQSIVIYYRSGGTPYEYSISHPIGTLPESKQIKDEYENSYLGVLNALDYIPFLIEWSEDGNLKEEELIFKAE